MHYDTGTSMSDDVSGGACSAISSDTLEVKIVDVETLSDTRLAGVTAERREGSTFDDLVHVSGDQLSGQDAKACDDPVESDAAGEDFYSVSSSVRRNLVESYTMDGDAGCSAGTESSVDPEDEESRERQLILDFGSLQEIRAPWPRI